MKAGSHPAKERLSRVYLDGHAVRLEAEPHPALSRIIRAGGKSPDLVDVVYLTNRRDRRGRPVHLDEVVDRAAEPARPIYLRSVPRGHGAGGSTSRSGQDGLGLPDIHQRTPATVPSVDRVIDQLGRQPRQARNRGDAAGPATPSRARADDAQDP